MHKVSATLLIIDDDEVVRESLAAYLEDSNFKVLQALNGLQGLQIFESEQPDLVICDLRMPQIDGLELIRRIRQTASETPIIVLSGAGVMSDAVEALRPGAADYLIKPLEDLAVLEHSVRRALDRAYLRVENQRYRDKLEAANRELQASLNLLQEDQNAGRQVQMNMLPVTPWSIEGLEFSTGSFRRCISLATSSTTSGRRATRGVLPGRRFRPWRFLGLRHGAAEVHDHAVCSTSRGATARSRSSSSSEVLAHINRGLINTKLGKHVTMLGGVIDLEKNSLTYSIGGHLPLPVLFVDGQASYLEGRGLPVGLSDDASYDDRVMELPLPSACRCFPDGILDVLPGATLKEKEASLPEQVAAAGGTFDGLRQVFGLANLAEMPDDIALLVLSRNLA